MPSTAIGSLQPGDYLVLALGLAVIVGAITPLFRKLTATQASGVAFGVLLFARPGVGAVTLALLFGLYALIYGFSQISAGIQLRQVGAGADPMTEVRDRV